MQTKFHKNWFNQDFVTNTFIREFYILNNNYEELVYLSITHVLLFVQDVNDEDIVKEHLLDIIRNTDGLKCYKCGVNHRRAKVYLTHVKYCGSTKVSYDSFGFIYGNLYHNPIYI